MMSYQNDNSIKWSFGDISSCQDDEIAKLTKYQAGKLTKCQVDEMAR